jgi:hypothetical protein
MNNEAYAHEPTAEEDLFMTTWLLLEGVPQTQSGTGELTSGRVINGDQLEPFRSVFRRHSAVRPREVIVTRTTVPPEVKGGRELDATYDEVGICFAYGGTEVNYSVMRMQDGGFTSFRYQQRDLPAARLSAPAISNVVKFPGRSGFRGKRSHDVGGEIQPWEMDLLVDIAHTLYEQ